MLACCKVVLKCNQIKIQGGGQKSSSCLESKPVIVKPIMIQLDIIIMYTRVLIMRVIVACTSLVFIG